MIRRGFSYGLLSTRRRAHSLLLPILTTATGAFLVVQVFSLTGSVKKQATTLGNKDEIFRATLLIAVVVLLVGVVEVAVCSTRTINQRTREIGLLGATGVPRSPVVSALMVEPLVAAAAGAVVGSVLAITVDSMLAAIGASSTSPQLGPTALGTTLAIAISIASAAITSILPSWRAASRPPIHSLSHGG
jgi:ABC-type antimicrobial peptide transport system permease subunit